MTERDWQREVVRLARHGGWVVFHASQAKRLVAGWPDLVLIRPPYLLAVELKTEDGKLSDEQLYLLAKFEACGIETHVWRPRDIAAVRERLRHGAERMNGE